MSQWWCTWAHPLRWPSAVPLTQIKKPPVSGCSVGCCSISWPRFVCVFYQRSSTTVVHPEINVAAYQRPRIWAITLDKVTDLQEAAAGGRSLEAAGLVGVIASLCSSFPVSLFQFVISLFYIFNYKVHAGSFSKWSCRKHLNSVVCLYSNHSVGVCFLWVLFFRPIAVSREAANCSQLSRGVGYGRSHELHRAP